MDRIVFICQEVPLSEGNYIYLRLKKIKQQQRKLMSNDKVMHTVLNLLNEQL
jgi:hypothetical protein